jgi:hypothetical protein
MPLRSLECRDSLAHVTGCQQHENVLMVLGHGQCVGRVARIGRFCRGEGGEFS